jgi:hypothetical protein
MLERCLVIQFLQCFHCLLKPLQNCLLQCFPNIEVEEWSRELWAAGVAMFHRVQLAPQHSFPGGSAATHLSLFYGRLRSGNEDLHISTVTGFPGHRSLIIVSHSKHGRITRGQGFPLDSMTAAAAAAAAAAQQKHQSRTAANPNSSFELTDRFEHDG